jgi:signal transduction histidine kinase
MYRPANERRLTKNDFVDLERLVRPVADREALRLEWKTDLPESLSVAAVGARQVLLNLLLNACAVTPPGGRVGLSARIEDGALVCEISDGGSGMPADHAQHLSGTGPAAVRSKRIGIDVIVSLLESLEGEASVRTDAGRGSTVVISIPLVSTHA